MCSQIGFTVASCLACKGEKHCSNILDRPAFCMSYSSIRPLLE